jgi:hypothetical protein
MKLSPKQVENLLDFACGGRFGASQSMVDLQTEGVAALCNILALRHVAYLADEVGLGKTMQALGVAAQVLHRKPGARILVITPRESVQNGWAAEFQRFNTYVKRFKSELSLQAHPSLRAWLGGLPDDTSIALLRHTSFARPVYLNDGTGRWADVVQALGLPQVDTLRDMPPASKDKDAVSRVFNEFFARATNRWFKREQIEFELVIVDEAQCLRHPENQSNTVLRLLLQGQVRNWLFVSATPAHSGVDNIATLMNQYPVSTKGPIITRDMLVSTNNFAALKETMSRYMIRRPRTFLINGRQLAKNDYRRDDSTSMAMTCQAPLDTLSIALVQKYLVSVLADNGNRFRSGYMASFESLSDSLQGRATGASVRHALLPETPEEDSHAAGDDFYVDPYHPQTRDTSALDTDFLQALSADFSRRFQIDLPHPKIDGVENDLRLAAFGDRVTGRVGGVKTLVFCRRLGSVRVLRQRLMARYQASIEARCSDVWGRRLDWTAGFEAPHDEGEDGLEDSADPPIDAGTDDDLNQVRVALRNKGWLQRFAATFRDGQRNALVFEQNWFARISADAGSHSITSARRIPLELWAEANAASLRAGKRYRRHQVRYLTWHALARWPDEVFGLTPKRAAHWQAIVRELYPDQSVYERVAPSEDGRSVSPEPDLLDIDSLWARLEAADIRLTFPGGAGKPCEFDDAIARQTLGNLLGQYLRLTDTLIDLRCADLAARANGGDMLTHFTGWLLGDDVDARRLRDILQAWVEHRVLILSSALGELQASAPLRGCPERFEFLAMLDPVVGVTGGGQGHKRPIQQFNTPGMPWVMVGTDTIREGVNLHLFCDRVMHYGVAWTAGDLEQRVGRVDRYFSRIERRLGEPVSRDGVRATLDIHYPHLADTLERQQIEAILDRKKTSDNAMASTSDVFATATTDFIELDAVSDSPVPDAAPAVTPFGTERHLPRRSRTERILRVPTASTMESTRD